MMKNELKSVPNNKYECCGCGVCEKICPKKAIKMTSDEKGFLYPKIDKNNCVNCELCLKHCVFYNSVRKQDKNVQGVYIAKHKNDKIRMNSRSGAVFVACSDYILENNGVVYGCIIDKNMDIKHARAENRKDRDKMCKSKYVQSDIINMLTKVKQDLNNNRKVLFTGVGCQVDALLNYLKIKKVDISNLYTMDIICHGVASPMIFKQYIKWLEKKYHGKVTNFDFRDKTICGWDGHMESAIINNKKYKLSYFRELFHTDMCIRPSCYNCKYSKVKRNSDITIGDAWGIKEALPSFNDNKGISIVISQTKKGNELLNVIRKNCIIKEVELEKFMQPNLNKPSKAKGNIEEFWKTYEEGDIDALIKKYGQVSIKKRIKSFIKYRIRKMIYGRKIYLP